MQRRFSKKVLWVKHLLHYWQTFIRISSLPWQPPNWRTEILEVQLLLKDFEKGKIMSDTELLYEEEVICESINHSVEIGTSASHLFKRLAQSSASFPIESNLLLD